MAKRKTYRKVNIGNNSEQWKLHQKLGKYLQNLDHVQDLAFIQKNKTRSAPLQFLDLIF